MRRMIFKRLIHVVVCYVLISLVGPVKARADETQPIFNTFEEFSGGIRKYLSFNYLGSSEGTEYLKSIWSEVPSIEAADVPDYIRDLLNSDSLDNEHAYTVAMLTPFRARVSVEEREAILNQIAEMNSGLELAGKARMANINWGKEFGIAAAKILGSTAFGALFLTVFIYIAKDSPSTWVYYTAGVLGGLVGFMQSIKYIMLNKAAKVSPIRNAAYEKLNEVKLGSTAGSQFTAHSWLDESLRLIVSDSPARQRHIEQVTPRLLKFGHRHLEGWNSYGHPENLELNPCALVSILKLDNAS